MSLANSRLVNDRWLIQEEIGRGKIYLSSHLLIRNILGVSHGLMRSVVLCVGSFAIVWSAVERGTGGRAAIKEVFTRQLSTKLQESLTQEIAVLQSINHPNVVKLFDIFKVRTDRGIMKRILL